MIKLEIYHRVIEISSDSSPFALSKRVTVNQKFLTDVDNKNSRTDYNKIQTSLINEVTLQRIIEKYSEQAVYRPIDDMRYYFQYAKRIFIEPGYPPLFYPAFIEENPSQNISAVCAIGEGIAGLILQQIYMCRKLVRPYKDGVDIIMTDDKSTYLVEAKGSAIQNSCNFIRKLGKQDLLEIIIETLSSYAIDNREVKGVLVGVHLKNESEYDCYITEINIDYNIPCTLDNFTNKKFIVYQQIETLIKQICCVQFLKKLSNEKMSPNLKINLQELVYIGIRNSVKNHIKNPDLKELTNKIINDILKLLKEEIDNKLYEDQISIIETYLKDIQKSLQNIYDKKERQKDKDNSIYNTLKAFKSNKQDEDELQEFEQGLQNELQEEIKKNDLSKKLINESIVLKLTKIEFNSYTEGLLIYPALKYVRQHCVITLNNLPEKFHTIEIVYREEIKNFPIEIYYGEELKIFYENKYDYIFIIDDDGSIYVNTQNLPTDSFNTAKTLLIQLAIALYK